MALPWFPILKPWFPSVADAQLSRCVFIVQTDDFIYNMQMSNQTYFLTHGKDRLAETFNLYITLSSIYKNNREHEKIRLTILCTIHQ